MIPVSCPEVPPLAPHHLHVSQMLWVQSFGVPQPLPNYTWPIGVFPVSNLTLFWPHSSPETDGNKALLQEGLTKLALKILPKQPAIAWGTSIATAGVGFISPTLQPSKAYICSLNKLAMGMSHLIKERCLQCCLLHQNKSAKSLSSSQGSWRCNSSHSSHPSHLKPHGQHGRGLHWLQQKPNTVLPAYTGGAMRWLPPHQLVRWKEAETSRGQNCSQSPTSASEMSLLPLQCASRG